jgi:deoxyribodipyrimidine photo-lyase
MSYRVVWFKRDLRLHDHVPLAEAARHGPVLCLYLLEPSLWAQPDAAAQHLLFIRECLQALDAELRLHGGCLHVAVGEAVAVLNQLHRAAPFEALHAHEETGNGHTFARDLAVGRWCREHGVEWSEWPQFGVTRCLQDRNQWQRRWEAFMAQPQADTPKLSLVARSNLAWPTPLVHVDWPAPANLGLHPWVPPQRQLGGRPRGLDLLHGFLHRRSARYRGGISSPLSAPTACSRLSAHLAYGTLSLREVVQATRAYIAAPDGAAAHQQGLGAFLSRLYWHCHFIQKLESEPALEFHNLHRGYDGLREPDWVPAHFDALVQGRTGWPMVDACVAMLRATGWLNFRMRAMLVSVAAYPLWLHWREVGHWLARQFLDYEPGIHWSQLQMQSGTTGINTTRVYNPIKQAHDHDPQGHFVRRWLPAMRRVPDSWLFEPWRMPPDVQARCGVHVGLDIPLPVVDLDAATREAKARLHARRAQPAVHAAKAAIVDKHGSRRGMPGGNRNARGDEVPHSRQLSLDF